MPYGAVPDDVEIQKLTSAQQDALSRHNIHENVNTFLANENTPLLMGGAALVALTPIVLPILLDFIRDAMAEAGTLIPDGQWKKIRDYILAAPFGVGGGLIVKQILERIDPTPTGAGFQESVEKYKEQYGI